jgi:hypothetical protein
MEKVDWKFVKEFPSLSTGIQSSLSPKSEKLSAFFNRKSANEKLVTITNRVAKLEKLREKALKEVEAIKHDIYREKELISQKNQEIQKKRRFSQETLEILQLKREANWKDRTENKQNIRDLTEKQLKLKQKLVQDKREKTAIWKEEVEKKKNFDLQEKNKNFKKIKTGYVKSLRERCLTQRRYRSMITSEYENSIELEKQLEQEAYQKISSLEKTESTLISQLSNTMQTQQVLKEKLLSLKTLSP